MIRKRENLTKNSSVFFYLHVVTKLHLKLSIQLINLTSNLIKMKLKFLRLPKFCVAI